MANPFDQFDAPRAAPVPAANPFDRFDAPASEPKPSGWPSLGSVARGVASGAAGDIEAVRGFLSNLSLTGLVKGAYEQGKSAVTLPRDVYEGRVDPRSDDALRRSLDFAGMASPITPASRIVLAAPAIQAGAQPAREASELGITLTAGQRTGDPALLSTENAMAGGAMGAPAQRVAQEAIDRQRAQVVDAKAGIGDAAGRGQADLARSADAGEAVAQGVRREAGAAKADYQRRYGEAFAQDGTLDPRFFTGYAEAGTRLPAVPGSAPAEFAAPLSRRITDNLVQRAEPVIVDATLTPAAHRALSELDGVANLQLGSIGQPGVADDVVGINLRGVDQARRKLAAYGRAAAANPSDRRAVQSIVGEFDAQVQSAMERGLFSGSDEALERLRDARAAFASYQRTFRPQGAGDDVGNALRAILERDATPEQVANYLYGAAKTGAAPLSVRLSDRLRGILGEESAEWAAVRQGAWMRALGPADTGVKRSSDRILDFIEGEGRSLATRLYSEAERAEMRRLAGVLRSLATRPGTTNPSNSGNRLAGLARQSFGILSSMIGASAGGPLGAAAGYAVGKGAEQFGAARAAGQARQMFSGEVPVSIGQRIADALSGAGAQAGPRLALPAAEQVAPTVYRAMTPVERD